MVRATSGRRAQRWISPDDTAPDRAKLVTPTSQLSNWERYAQKPAGGFFTSTGAGETCSWLAALEYVGESPADFPLVQYHLEVSPDAQIFEVDGPSAWHRLCTRYPAQGENGQLVPNWPAVARVWDAVHLTLGGLLTSEQVRVEMSPAGRSTAAGRRSRRFGCAGVSPVSRASPTYSRSHRYPRTRAGRGRSCSHRARMPLSAAGLTRHLTRDQQGCPDSLFGLLRTDR
ncbi:MAG TPA: hypothetical protein VFS96_07105 [Nitrolancea sp.]|nr:hypothetical protein [Nitrolancea sp.]